MARKGPIQWVKDVIRRMFRKRDFENFHMATAITDTMAAAIDNWVAMYYNRPAYRKHGAPTLGLPAAIAHEMATTVTLEAKINVGNPERPGDDDSLEEAPLNPRALFISECLQPLRDQLEAQVEYACAFGGLVFRPYVSDGAVAIDFINADNFYPAAYNARGKITSAVFVEKKKVGTDLFIRLERHDMLGNGKYQVTNRAYRSVGQDARADIGTPIALTDVPEWADIEPDVTMEGVDEPLFAYFKMPQANIVDVNSPLGVSIYARAESAGMLKEADQQLGRMLWEYEGGQMAIDASIDAFKRDSQGNVVLPAGKERLYRVNELDPMSQTTMGKFSIFAPELRDSAYADGLNRILMRIEDLCCLSRGTLSDANEQMRTATELKINKQRTYAAVTSIQMSLQAAIIQLAKAIDTYASLYDLAQDGEYELSFTWDDSVVTDATTEREADRQDVLDGIMQPWEYRVKWYGETKSAAKAATEFNDTPADTSTKKVDEEEEPEITEE